MPAGPYIVANMSTHGGERRQTAPADLRDASNRMRISLTPIILMASVVAGCRSVQVPALSAAGMHVRAITAEQGLLCNYIKNVAYNTRLRGWGKSYEAIHQAAENGLRNMVASVGANAYVLTRSDADSFSGRINYAGQAFECSSKVTSIGRW